ncbi:hypothetical protein PSI15_03025 [Xenorhabdus sp. PR6a]|uniref:hypothetical protein n=1 Tax=Xenorhabdus sp. PR6a TaxID=3025877 RepID=UPI00235A2F8A|nr:hypothetical protein [Xenorhabdus sp. PR6a]MDC9580551.1 hypothetical protein [Xenorhabdus sp. PR6a]
MNRKLAACILSLILGTIVTANANALIANSFDNPIKSSLAKICHLIPFEGTILKIARTICL